MRVIYSYFANDIRRHIVQHLDETYGWTPVFFHGKEDLRPWVKQSYPQALFHDTTAMRQSNFDYTGLGTPVAIDKEIIDALNPYAMNYLNWLEDTTGWNFSLVERRRYYYDTLKYWNTVIQCLKPELYVANNMPHIQSDYPLYLLCKHYYKIPVLFINPFPLLDDDYYAVGNSLEDLSTPFQAAYFSAETLTPSQPVKDYLDRLRSPGTQIPKHITRYWQKLDLIHRSRYKDILRLLKMMLQGTAFKKSTMGFKKNQEPWESDASKLTNFDYFIFKSRLARKNNQMKVFYHGLAQEPDLTKKYIYFPGPYQPEVLSNLYAGVYEDIFLILDMITALLPPDWVIYYKEHPNTFKAADKGGLMRSENFYRKLAAYAQLRMVPTHCSTYALTDQSRAVCTVGGTAGWEAVVRGKPALFFGSIWYQCCKSVFVINTVNDAAKAMQAILKGYVPDSKDVDRYAEAMYRSSEHGLIIANEFERRIAACKDAQFEMERIAKAYYNAYQQFYANAVKGQTPRVERSSHERVSR